MFYSLQPKTHVSAFIQQTWTWTVGVDYNYLLKYDLNYMRKQRLSLQIPSTNSLLHLLELEGPKKEIKIWKEKKTRWMFNVWWLLSWQRLSNNNSVWGFHKLLLECFMCNLFLLMLMFLYRLLFFAHKVMRHGIYFTLKAECSFISLMSPWTDY